MSLLTDQEQARLIDAETHALEGASLADVMTTLASLPLPENEDYAPMQEHIRLALAIHGVVPNSPECIKLSEGILIHLATERERLLRFFESAARAREEMGQPRITCEDCALCGAIQATDRIRKTEPMPPTSPDSTKRCPRKTTSRRASTPERPHPWTSRRSERSSPC